MKSDEKLWEICKEIYKRMFKEAKPSSNYNNFHKVREVLKSDWFMYYYLPQERQVEIIDKICEKHKIGKKSWERKKIDHTIHLGHSPNTSIETWKKLRENKEVSE